MGAGFAAATTSSGVRTQVVGPEIVDGPREVQQFGELLDGHTAGISLCTLSSRPVRSVAVPGRGRGHPGDRGGQPAARRVRGVVVRAHNNVRAGRCWRTVIDQLLPDAHGTSVIGTSTRRARGADRRATDPPAVRRAPARRGVLARSTASRRVGQPRGLATPGGGPPDALAFLGTGDADGWNLATIRHETRGRWLARAFDLDPRALAAVRSHDLALVSPEHFLKGALAGRLQARAARARRPAHRLGVRARAWPSRAERGRGDRAAGVGKTRRAALMQVDRVLGDLPDHIRQLADVG